MQKPSQPRPISQELRISVLRLLKAAGIFDIVRDSQWRQRRLLIVCYHSLAIDEEHQWRPALFMAANHLQERLEILKNGGYNVLPLGEALQRLYRNDLPPRSVALTFDDGTCDFCKLTYPLLKSYGFPATVYQTTYYSDRRMPVFSLICSYMLWKKRDSILKANPNIGLMQETNLSTPEARQTALNSIVDFAERGDLSTLQKNELSAELARLLDVDYRSLLDRRILQLMTSEEICELSAAGIDFELHTHRHRTPRNQVLFEKEIDDNRRQLQAITRSCPVHFCYPSGDYDLQFLPWLAEKGVISAATCEPGLASARNNPLLLPRFVDTTGRTALEFESWLTGVGALVSIRAGAAKVRSWAES